MERNSRYIFALLAVSFFVAGLMIPAFPMGVFFYMAPLLALVGLPERGMQNVVVLGALALITLVQWLVIGGSALDGIFFLCSHVLLIFTFHWVSKRYKTSFSILSFILLGVVLEYSWLLWIGGDVWVLFDRFSGSAWTQWYSYTGLLGGTFWVLTVNAVAYLVLFKNNPFNNYRWRWRSALLLVLVILVPILISINILGGSARPTILPETDVVSRWTGLLVLENPDLDASLWKQYGEYLARTCVWLLIFVWLSIFVKLKTHGRSKNSGNTSASH